MHSLEYQILLAVCTPVIHPTGGCQKSKRDYCCGRLSGHRKRSRPGSAVGLVGRCITGWEARGGTLLSSTVLSNVSPYSRLTCGLYGYNFLRASSSVARGFATP